MSSSCGCRACVEADRLALEGKERAAMVILRQRYRRDVRDGREGRGSTDHPMSALFEQPSMDTRSSEIGGALRGVCGRCPGVPAHPHHDKP